MDLVIRAVVIFFFILAATRIAGKREISSLQPFDLILLVVLGDLVQQGITHASLIVIRLGVEAYARARKWPRSSDCRLEPCYRAPRRSNLQRGKHVCN